MQSLYWFFVEVMQALWSFIGVAAVTLGLASEGQDKPALASMPLPDDIAGLSIDDALAQLAAGGQVSPELRRQMEKRRLFDSLDPNAGTWGLNHPRHRLLDALLAYQKYYERGVVDINRHRSLFKGVTRAQKSLLDKTVKYSKKFDRVEAQLKLNQKLCDKIVASGLAYYNITTAELKKHEHTMRASGKNMDRVSAGQSLKHFVRDWTPAGEMERVNTFPCLLETMDELFPERKEAASPIKVLLPGSGLNRLAHDVAALEGFEVTANEWSTFMNMAYRYMESEPQQDASTFQPFIDNWSHHASEDDMLRTLTFPEKMVHPDAILVVEGDFTTVFEHEAGQYDVILTYFFIDTARNLMAYFDTIKKLLKTGGKWINLGPLLYGTGPYVQLSLDEVVTVTEAMGFKYLPTDEKWGPLTLEDKTPREIEAIYSFNDKALTRSAYRAQFWVAEKE